jgi:hypothetical protein
MCTSPETAIRVGPKTVPFNVDRLLQSELKLEVVEGTAPLSQMEPTALPQEPPTVNRRLRPSPRSMAWGGQFGRRSRRSK